MTQEKFDILIAEDDTQVAHLLNVLLTKKGFSVSVANDGKEAMDIIDSHPAPKLALLDIMMPYHDGFQLIEHIRKKSGWSNVPIVMLTAKSQQQDISRALSMGANEYLVKPFEPISIVNQLERLMQKTA